MANPRAGMSGLFEQMKLTVGAPRTFDGSYATDLTEAIVLTLSVRVSGPRIGDRVLSTGWSLGAVTATTAVGAVGTSTAAGAIAYIEPVTAAPYFATLVSVVAPSASIDGPTAASALCVATTAASASLLGVTAGSAVMVATTPASATLAAA